MERRTLLLCDREEDYVKQMSSFIRENDTLAWRVATLTKVPTEMSEKITLLLIAESMYETCRAQLDAEVTIVLSESGLCKWKNVEYVDKYQRADEVYRRILEIYTGGHTETVKRLGGVRRGKIVGFYSPAECGIQEAVVLTYGQNLAQKHKVLYVGMRSFSGFPELWENLQEDDLMTVLYYLDSDKVDKVLAGSVTNVGKLAILTCRCGHNLSGITPSQWEKFLNWLLRCGNYDYILLDMTDAVQGGVKLLHQCHSVYTFSDGSSISKCRIMQYRQLQEHICGEVVLEKTLFLELPPYMKVPTYASELTKSEIVDYIQLQGLRE